MCDRVEGVGHTEGPRDPAGWGGAGRRLHGGRAAEHPTAGWPEGQEFRGWRGAELAMGWGPATAGRSHAQERVEQNLLHFAKTARLIMEDGLGTGGGLATIKWVHQGKVLEWPRGEGW